MTGRIATDTLAAVQPQSPPQGDTIQAALATSALARDDSTAGEIASVIANDREHPAEEDTVAARPVQTLTLRADADTIAADSMMSESDRSVNSIADLLDAGPKAKSAPGIETSAPDTISIALRTPIERVAPSVKGVSQARRPDTLQDSDGDGVPDAQDLCLHTPLNAVVNEAGCPLDDDGDGVYDGLDLCPGTPKFVRMVVDSLGCPADEDGDGVPDYLDYCPDTPRGLEVTKLGCLPDGDADGIADIDDQCPDTPKGMQVDGTGCLIMTQLNRQLALQINFVPETSALDLLSRRILDDLVIRMAATPGIVAVIEGGTDGVASDTPAGAVSQSAIDRVVRYLADRGIDQERIMASDASAANGIVAGDATPVGQPENYRIEISFYSADE